MGQGLNPDFKEDISRRRVLVEGVVQGVGFRPFVYNLARELDLAGFVTNTAAGVDLAVQGPEESLLAFCRRLVDEAPPLSRITEVTMGEEPPVPGDGAFIIEKSRAGTRRTLISPDVCVCEDCRAELFDPADRRFRYPFINCTNCGPRYTIIRDLPYDRPQTTMNIFTMCPECQAEYDDPGDRRFHAQPNACAKCGPRVWLAGPDGQERDSSDPIRDGAVALKNGLVLGVKGLGGFHLACDALNEEAVQRLRRRKHREEKPLALMVPGLTAAEELVHLDDLSREALSSRERPIVLCPAREDSPAVPALNPRNRLLGVMLPYTPLHFLLLREGFTALVMTSGNVSGEPICLENQEAVERIGAGAPRGGIADLFLMHNRGIYLRSDDSVVRVVGGELRQLRRSRGYVPAPVILPLGAAPEEGPVVLAAGAHLKNTLCLLRGREAFLSQHVGDLDNLGAMEFFELTAGHLQNILEAPPELIACDLHPDYLSSRWAQDQGIPLVRVQHHHAHAVAVIAEHGLEGEVLGLSLDGTGLGDDGTIWGGELMAAQSHGYSRLGHLHHFPLPGGEAAVKEPWRTGLALLREADDERLLLELPLARNQEDKLPLITKMIDRGINSPVTSSLGRLFDGAAAICGLRDYVAYEGQAAVELEQAMAKDYRGEGYPFTLYQEGDFWVLDWREAICALANDARRGIGHAIMAARFHRGLLMGLAVWAAAGAEYTGLERIVLGGGCMMNAFLLANLPGLLAQAGLTVYTPSQVPANDGGLSLGQAVVAAAARRQGLA